MAATLKDVLLMQPQSQKLIRKVDLLDNVVFKAGAECEEVMGKIRDDVKGLIRDNNGQDPAKMMHIVGTLAYALTCLISYKRNVLFPLEKDLFECIHSVVDQFRQTIPEFRRLISKEGEDKESLDAVRQFDQCLQLFLFVTEEGKIASDLNKLSSILSVQSGS